MIRAPSTVQQSAPRLSPARYLLSILEIVSAALSPTARASVPDLAVAEQPAASQAA